MFDWNDEELANIIWGEAGASDDHIVPYPEVTADLGNKKEWNLEATSIKLTEQKRPEVKIDVHCRKPGSTSKLDSSGGLSASGYDTNSWPDLSLSTAAETGQGSLGTEVSKTFSEIRTFNSSREETAQLGKDVEVFQSSNEGKEQGDYGDYGWGNMGSFDDFDRIFSNDDPIFGNASLDNAGELWSSKDVSNSTAPISLDAPSTSGALRNRSEPLEIKADDVQCNDQLFALSHGKIGGSACHGTQNVHAMTTDVTYCGERSKPAGKEHQDIVGRITSSTSGLTVENVATANELADKAFGQNNLLKVQKKSQGKQEAKGLQNFYGSWSPSTNLSNQFENQLTPSVMQSSPPSVLGKQKQIQGAEAFYQNIMNPYLVSPFYGNPGNAYPAIPMLSQAQSDLRHQHLLSGYDASSNLVNPVRKSGDLVKPLTMTPQEKIEKLRRRQQMQAMLAIQKQQQQLGNQVPSTNKFINQTYLLEMQNRSSDGTDPEVEDRSSFPALEPPIEQDDSDTVSAAIDGCFVEETTLYKLQDIISKACFSLQLDIKIRLCIRDSLFRLAQSATERNPASDSSSTNKTSREEHNVLQREEINCQNRYVRMPHSETETNPIDRTVAHLLFHRPLELNGNYADKLDSPISARTQNRSHAANLSNLTVKCLPDENMNSNKQFSDQGLKNSCSLIEAQAQPMDQFRNSPCIGTSENASNNGPADVGAQELEASQ
ncbi:protein LNK2-like isoform X2 [Prosopis cineraria]|uniref:protein LNK2-like isoform X2 n=1 Tax=Prosopis cineraria TaxID=364024 RepID=UPI00240F4DA6|nr:protein LNK2-like isoform X2 [Prosopis cineraria]